jgi:hypothetical protein
VSRPIFRFEAIDPRCTNSPDSTSEHSVVRATYYAGYTKNKRTQTISGQNGRKCAPVPKWGSPVYLTLQGIAGTALRRTSQHEEPAAPASSRGERAALIEHTVLLRLKSPQLLVCWSQLLNGRLKQLASGLDILRKLG